MKATNRMKELQVRIKVDISEIKELRVNIIEASNAADWFVTQTQREYLFDAEAEVIRADTAIIKLSEAIEKLCVSLGEVKK